MRACIAFALLCGCNHMGGLGRAAEGFGRVAGEVGRATAPIAEHVARAAPVVARDAVIATATTLRVATLAAAVGEATNDDASGAEVPSQTITDDGVHSCEDCPKDETCFYVDYVCPALVGLPQDSP